MNPSFSNIFKALLLCITEIISVTCMAQTETHRESEVVLPPLGDLIDSAIKHSSAVKFRTLEIDAKECNLKSYKNYWTRNFGIQADTRYGTFDNYSTAANNGQSTTISASTTRQLNYGVGTFFKFPVQDLVNRKNLIRQAQVELAQANQMALVQQDEVRQLVIRQYQDVLLKQRLLRIKSSALGNARINREMIEKQFRNGNIPVAEYVRISDIVDRVESDYETAKAEFATTRLILEDMVGFTFRTVLSTKNENN